MRPGTLLILGLLTAGGGGAGEPSPPAGTPAGHAVERTLDAPGRRPGEPADSPRWKVLDAGHAHACGVVRAGDAYCWGSNYRGQLGDGTTKPRPAPVRVAGEVRFTQVSAGFDHTCGVTDEGEAYCWGGDLTGQIGDGDPSAAPRGEPVPVNGERAFRQVSAGEGFTCGITRKGDAYCWGLNDRGQLGAGTTESPVPEPARVAGLREVQLKRVAAGAEHACALGQTGTVYCWGDSASGQVGSGEPGRALSPVRVSGDAEFVDLSAGDGRTCGVARDGAAYCWGSLPPRAERDAPASASAPREVAGLSGVRRIASGGFDHACAVARDGGAYCWGANRRGQLGADPPAVPAGPTPVAGALRLTRITAGDAFTCGLTEEGEAYCWGQNDAGQLGVADTRDRREPTRLE